MADMNSEREALRKCALRASQCGEHIYTHPRDSNNWKANEAWQAKASPAVVVSLLDRITELESLVKSAAGASLAASAGSEPVAWRTQFDQWWSRNRVSTHQVKNIGGFAAKVWHAAVQTVVGATDSTAGFYPADEGSTPSRQTTHPSPPEGMVGGWRPIETAPKDGRTLLLGYFNSANRWRTTRGQWMSQDYIDEYAEDPDCMEPGWRETTVEDDSGMSWLMEPTHWMPLPPPPPSAEGVSHGGAG